MKSKLLIFLLSFVFCSLFGANLKLENEIKEEQNTIILNDIIESSKKEENIILENIIITEEKETNDKTESDTIVKEEVIVKEQKNVEIKSQTQEKVYIPKQEEIVIEEPIQEQIEIEEIIQNPVIEQTSKPEPEPEPEHEPEPKQEIIRCTNNNNHGMDVGNSGKWFSSKKEAIAYYDNKLDYWDKWVKEDPDNRWDEYLQKCPSGYEVWDCMFCGKWTINFYYR